MEIEKNVFLIGNAHIDPVWLWRFTEGYAEVKATFRSALDRIEEFDGFVFTSACACYYRWIEETDTDMFEEIRKRVNENRWVLGGGMWIQPDCNIPSGESFARQTLYSQRYFKEKFGKIASFGYNVDSFGHNGMLPQLLSKSGMDYYVFMRPGEHEKTLPDVFRWASPDGSEVIAARLPMSYGDWYNGNESGDGKLPPAVNKALDTKKLALKNNMPLMCFYGVGNHGGGPTIKVLNQYKTLIQNEKDIVFGDPKRYFAHISHMKENLPLIKEDLQHHASGCYSAVSAVKAKNRLCEAGLVTAEKWLSISNMLINRPYNGTRLKEAWEAVMFNQFHDILAGCSIKSACEDALEAFDYALHVGAETANRALQSISWRVDTTKGKPVVRSKESDWLLWETNSLGAPAVVFNPHSFPLISPVIINKELKGAEDAEGNPIPLQLIRGEQTNGKDIYNTLLMAKIPAMGYNVLWLYGKTEKPFEIENPCRAEGCILENAYTRLEIDPKTGCVLSLSDKKTGRIILKNCKALIIDETDSDTWAHGIFSFRDEIGRFSGISVKVLENGPVRAVIRAESRFNDSYLTQDFQLYYGRSEVEVRVKLNFNEKHKMIKLAFPAELSSYKAVYEMPYGFIEKAPDGLEEPLQRFFAVRGMEGSVGIINDGKYSADVLDEMRLTISRSPAYADHFGNRDEFLEYTDQGFQSFNYIIAWHDGEDIDSYALLGRTLNEKPSLVMETYHEGSLPVSYEGIKINSPYICAGACKRAEEDNGFILRLTEISGRRIEKVVIDFTLLNRIYECSFEGQEIKTLFFPDNKEAPVEVFSLIEEKL